MSSSDDMVLEHIGFPGSAASHEITIEDKRIVSVRETAQEIQWICLPPLVDMHVHANRAYTLGQDKPGSFQHAIELTMALLRDFGAAEYRCQALKLFERAYAHATTGIRTHADIDASTGLDAVTGTLEAVRSIGSKMDIETVAFASSRLDPATRESQIMLKDAIQVGAGLLGAVPAFYPDPPRSIAALLELATELGVAVDVHQDEHLDPDQCWCETLAEVTISNGYQGRVTLSHGCVLSVLNPIDRQRIIDKLATAEITVVALPITNLYLQDRRTGTPLLRGLTSLHELQQAGVAVRLATDNVQDAFYPYGDADLLETAYIGMLAGHFEDSIALVRAICNGRDRVREGDSAEMVLIRATSFDEVLARRPAERELLRAGELVATN